MYIITHRVYNILYIILYITVYQVYTRYILYCKIKYYKKREDVIY